MSSAAHTDRGDVRRRLIEEAARILAVDGPSALSVRRLAAGVGTSTMAVYTHFGSLSAVVDEVATEGFRRVIEHVGAAGVTDDPIDDLLRSAGGYRDNALENPHLYGVMFGSVSVRGLGGAGPDREVARAAFEQLVALVRRAMDAGALRSGDPAVVAAQFWSALHGYVTLELAGMSGVVDDPEHDVLWPMLSHLLSALAA